MVSSEAEKCGGSDFFIRACVPTALSTAKRKAFSDVRKRASAIRGDIREKLKAIREDLNDSAVEAGIMDRVVIRSVAVDVRDKVQSAIDGIDVNGDELYDKVPGRVRRFFSGISVNAVPGMVVSLVEPVVRENVDICYDTLADTFTQNFDTEFESLIKEFKAHCDKRKVELAEAKKELSKARARKVELESGLAAAKSQKVVLENSEREMKHFLGVAV